MRGLDADLHFLPDAQCDYHFLMPVFAHGFISRAGGVLEAVRQELARSSTNRQAIVVQQGRVLSLHMQRDDDVLNFLVSHVYPSLGRCTRRFCLLPS